MKVVASTLLQQLSIATAAVVLVGADMDAVVVGPGRRSFKNPSKNMDSLRRELQIVVAGATPVQTYMIPLREKEFIKNFNTIHPTYTSLDDPVMSLTSIAMSVRGTVVWYDHWEGPAGEDGYEIDVTNPTQSSTLVWGDGDWTNGCVEKVRQEMIGNSAYSCSSSDIDIINAGEALVLKSSVPANRAMSDFFYDGGDLIRASFPVALTRGGYPDNQYGGYLGGAVELLETKNWGKEFIVPVGIDIITNQNAFTMTDVWLMASVDGTTITKNGVLQGVINKGEEFILRNSLTNDAIVTSEPVQATIVTGEIISTFEMRWYSLLTTSKWYNDYYTPLHKTEISTATYNSTEHKILLFNPGPTSITVQHYERDVSNGGRMLRSTYDINPGTSELSAYLSLGKAAQFKTDDPSHIFYALAIADFDDHIDSAGLNWGQRVDWGFPLIPANKLTSQALIGLGWGCVNNDCGPEHVRSVVWVTPTVDADIYVDFDGDGFPDGNYAPMFVEELQGITVKDDVDTDMTGATIWATKPGSPADIDGVYIAVAWGQDSFLARTGTEPYSLDMGTVVMPLPEITATKSVAHAPEGDRDGDGQFSIGDIIQYTIRLTNTGRIDIPVDAIEIVDEDIPLLDHTTYVTGSTKYVYQEGSGGTMTVDVSDDPAPETPFPLDGTGLENQAILLVGSAHQVTFEVEISSAYNLTSTKVVNIGHMKHNSKIKDTFEVATPLTFHPSIDIQTTVSTDPGDCPGVESLVGLINTPIMYCYVITNTGDIFLDLMDFSDDIGSDLSSQLNGVLLGPGESITFSSPDQLMADETNTGNIAGNPTLSNGDDVAGLDAVTDSDPANVIITLTEPPTFEPSSSPTTKPSAAPVPGPTSTAPTSVPTVAPIKADHPLNGDLCKDFDTTMTSPTTLAHFAFIARTTQCVRALVYISELPLTAGELDGCCSGILESHWTLLCDGYVMGMGDTQHTYIDQSDCVSYEVAANTTRYFHISMEYADEQTYCTDPNIISSNFDLVDTIEAAQNVQCSVP